MKLSHLDEHGAARMVDVSGKDDTHRTAVARGRITMKRETLEQIQSGGIAKGDVLATARLAGILAAKRTSDAIPLCHPLTLTSVRTPTHRLRGGCPRHRDNRHRSLQRTHGRGDGSTACGCGCMPDRLRHGEGHRPRHAHQ